MMDFNEFYLMKNFNEVLPHLDDTIRMIILEERVPYAARPQQQTISAGSLVIPTMVPDRTQQLPNSNCIGTSSSKCSFKLGKIPSTAIVSKFKTGFNKPVVKKRRALPYEKICASVSGIGPLFTRVDKHTKASDGLHSRYSNNTTSSSSSQTNLQTDTCTQTDENISHPAQQNTDRVESAHCQTCQEKVPLRTQSRSASDTLCSNVVKNVPQTTSLQHVCTSSKCTCVCKPSSPTVEEYTQLQTKPPSTGVVNKVTACTSSVKEVTQLQTKPPSTGVVNKVMACTSSVKEVTQLQTKPSSTSILNEVTACTKSVQTYQGKRKRTCSNAMHVQAIGEGTSLNSRRISAESTTASANSAHNLQEVNKHKAGRISTQAGQSRNNAQLNDDVAGRISTQTNQSRNNAQLNDDVAVRVRYPVGTTSSEADQSVLETTLKQSKHVSTCDKCCPNFGKTLNERKPLLDKLISTDDESCSNLGKSWQETAVPISDSDTTNTPNAAQVTQEFTLLPPKENQPHIDPTIPSKEHRIDHVKQSTSQRSTANDPDQQQDVSYSSRDVSSQRTMVTPSASGTTFDAKTSSVANTGLTATATSSKSSTFPEAFDQNTEGKAEEKSDINKKEKKPIEIGMMDEMEIEAFIQELVSAQNIYAPFPANPGENADKKREKEISTAEAGNMATHGKSGTGTKKENMKDTLMASIVSYFEKKILETVRFSKRIPGFLNLPRDDQANLIKESRNESDLISAMRCFNEQDNSFVSLEGDHYTFQDLSSIVSEETVHIYAEGGIKVGKLNATQEEAALLRAITITSSDRCELICKDEVEDIQNRLVTCLLHVVKKGSMPTGKRMGQLFDFLLFCRNVTDVALKNLKKIILKEDKYSDNPIITEVL